MSFWQSGSGTPITGEASKAFAGDFRTIPEGTMAHASIHAFELVNKEQTDYAPAMKFYQITWKLTSGEFKNRQVTQKIKCFDGSPEAIDRNLNMLKLVMDLCKFKPAHAEAPTQQDLMPMMGAILGVKIREWSMPKKDGSGMMEGNFVAEVFSPVGFEDEAGVKAEVKHVESNVDSAFSRNKPVEDELFSRDDVPF